MVSSRGEQLGKHQSTVYSAANRSIDAPSDCPTEARGAALGLCRACLIGAPTITPHPSGIPAAGSSIG